MRTVIDRDGNRLNPTKRFRNAMRRARESGRLPGPLKPLARWGGPDGLAWLARKRDAR